MKLEAIMCHTHFVSMMLMPELLQRATTSYTSTCPDYDNEGFIGYMEIKASFDVKDLDAFNELWNKSRVYPSERSEWYHFIKTNVAKCGKDNG
jgi:hypothetical protein